MRAILLGTFVIIGFFAPQSHAKGGSCRDRAQANGSIVTGDNRRDRASFHIKGEQRGDSFSGRLDFTDRNGDRRIRSRRLVDYQQIDTETRQLTFALSDEPDDVAVVVLRDFGKGRNDFFELTAGDYTASGNLRNGNVRIQQKGNCDTPDDNGTDNTGAE